MSTNNKKNKGFTLVELLVVIAIVALLSSIALVAMNSARTSSRDTKRTADLKQVAAALEIYFDEFSQYPYNGTGTGGYNELDQADAANNRIWDSSCAGGDSDDEFLTSLKEQGMMMTLPDDPSYRTVADCYLYTSTIRSSGDYADGYYLMARFESASTINNCGSITLPAGNRFCLA